MTNPFEDPNGSYCYHALVNGEGQYSLWPTFVDVPSGWQIAYPEKSRDDCLAYIEQHWTDMRPTSLIRATEADRLRA